MSEKFCKSYIFHGCEDDGVEGDCIRVSETADRRGILLEVAGMEALLSVSQCTLLRCALPDVYIDGSYKVTRLEVASPEAERVFEPAATRKDSPNSTYVEVVHQTPENTEGQLS